MKFFPDKYETVVADYKLLITISAKWIVATSSVIMVPVAIFIIIGIASTVNDYFNTAIPVIVFLYLICNCYKRINNRTVIEVDNEKGTITLCDSKVLNRSDVLYLKITKENSNGYYYDYLSLAAPLTSHKIMRMNRNDEIVALALLIAKTTKLQLVQLQDEKY